MNRVLLMTGAILAITILATSAIVPIAEAKPFSDRKDSGIVANCRVSHVGTSTIICTFSDKDGVGAITWNNSAGTDNSNGKCDNKYSASTITGDGDLQITITDCAGDPNTVTFCYHKDGKKLTQLAC